MKTLILLFALLTLGAEARIVTDDYGRVVTVPQKITRIYAASPPIAMGVLAFDPSLIVSINMPFNDEQKKYLGAAASKPVAGGYFGQGQTPNFELLAASKPDVILVWGKMSGVENALAKFSALKIPILLIRNSSINDLASQFRLYGLLTGNTKRADELIAYTKETLNLIQSLQKPLEGRKETRYYFAESLDGLSSECNGSYHLEPFEYAGAKNALNCKIGSNYGMSKISLETIMMADPDVIVAMESGFAESIKNNPKWQSLRAVKSNHIFTVPNTPFNYITRPPSFMRLLGIRWLIRTFDPDLIKPIDQEVERFNKLFFPQFKS